MSFKKTWPLINLYDLNRISWFHLISISIIDRDRYLEIAVIDVDNASYLPGFKTIKLLFNNYKIFFLQCII